MPGLFRFLPPWLCIRPGRIPSCDYCPPTWMGLKTLRMNLDEQGWLLVPGLLAACECARLVDKLGAVSGAGDAEAS